MAGVQRAYGICAVFAWAVVSVLVFDVAAWPRETLAEMVEICREAGAATVSWESDRCEKFLKTSIGKWERPKLGAALLDKPRGSMCLRRVSAGGGAQLRAAFTAWGSGTCGVAPNRWRRMWR